MTELGSSKNLFYHLSVKGKKATTMDPEEAAALTSSLTPSSLGEEITSPDTAANPNLSVAQSWKVSDDEYVIRIDASPLHASAAQRLFGGGVNKIRKLPPKQSGAITEEDVDQFIATIDETPLHLSAARRTFGGATGKKKISNGEEEGDIMDVEEEENRGEEEETRVAGEEIETLGEREEGSVDCDDKGDAPRLSKDWVVDVEEEENRGEEEETRVTGEEKIETLGEKEEGSVDCDDKGDAPRLRKDWIGLWTRVFRFRRGLKRELDTNQRK